ncbi:hypothetical protein FHL15_007646 [Xylaria flabelliformis]|uniref:Uncharacterized protein n=1 Tax=Xylaria flabelliformis TaxID=2512241 RepID=A0A553HTY7_9PEZI|nr:hypothetical protein FHL15_007646 [Xylaria flabelliformis]
MAPMGDPDKGVNVFQRLEDLYKDGVLPRDDHEAMDTKTANLMQGILSTPKGYDPSITIPNIINYLRDNDAGRDVDWDTNFTLIRGYLADAHRRMVTGSLGFGDSKLRAALEDARVMVRVHLHFEKRAGEKTPWTDSILRGQTMQERLLTYPRAFPLPESDRSNSRYRPIKHLPRPNDYSPLWNTTLRVTDPLASSVLAEVDDYVDSENKFFQSAQKSAKTGKVDDSTWKNNRFVVENRAYEDYMSRGPAGTCADPPPPYNDGQTGETKSPAFYRRRGWQRAALQQCLNLFTSHENRAINTPWRRPVLPYDPPPLLPKEIAYVPRVVDHCDEKVKDPFSWLHWSSQHAKIVDFLAACQRRNYNQKSWDDFSAPALPKNFRGPQIYRGLTVHDQHWLKIGDYLENLENLIQSAWSAAPRPFLRAILRDFDAGRRENTGGSGMDNSYLLPTEDNDDMLDRKRYWRRDIKRRIYIDNQRDDTNDDNYKLVDDFDIAWLRYLCEPSRTLEMCDPSKQPSQNLATIFDAKLQSYFRNLEVSGYPDSKALSIWGENYDDLDDVKRTYKPSTLRAAVAYINGCTESELIYSGEKDPNPEHPNACYQYSVEEAEFICVELSNLGRCVYIPERGNEPARVGRPSYNVHPEDRVRWRYLGMEQFHSFSEKYLDEMVDHYDASYGKWPSYLKNRPRFSRELEFMLDHTGPDFHYELERVETQDKHPGTKAALGRRRAFIRDYLAPEGLCRIGDIESDSIENVRAAPRRKDLAPWEAVGAYLTKYHEQHKDMHDHMRYYYPGDLQHPQTPERTAQFFRNLAYRAGRTLRYVDQIKDRLQYLENNTKAVASKPPLDLSGDLKEPRPENSGDPPVPAIVEKWWQAISVKDHDFAIKKWNAAIKEGAGELALLPPDINEVLERADPLTYRPSFQNPRPIDEKQNPFTIIREGIIENCFQNRPTMYPGRLSGFKDQTKNEFQGYERPSLFEWATKDQRRYQAPHTRRHFFNMQRWPPSRILPHRREAIRARKDEVVRKDPSKRDQAYGILTNRVPIGKEKPLYAHPLIHHHGRAPDDDWRSLMPPPYKDIKINNSLTEQYTRLSGAKDKGKNKVDKEENNPDFSDVEDDSVNMAGLEPDFSHIYDKDLVDPGSFDIDDTTFNYADDIKTQNKGATPGGMGTTTPKKPVPRKGLVTPLTPEKTPAKPTAPMEPTVESKTGIKSAKGVKFAKVAKPAATGRSVTARAMSGFVPFERSNQKFAPGPAVFPMGDTLLQKVLISHELNHALYPEKPFYKRPLLGLPKVWQKIISADVPLVPLVPKTARSNIPRSNPRKRKMPIEFLNNSANTKKFRSDKSVPLMPGGNGGQFGAATAVEVEVSTSGETDTESVVPPLYKNFQNTGVLPKGGSKKGIPPMTMPTKPAKSATPAPETKPSRPAMPATEALPIKPPPASWSTNPTKAVKPAIPTPSTAGLGVVGQSAVEAQTQKPKGFVSLRVYPNPSRKRAKDYFEHQFAGVKWTSSNVDYKYLFSAACRSLAASINAQYADTELQTTPEALSELAKTAELAVLHPYMYTNDNDYFDIHCVAYLLQVFGEQHDAKIQLGVVQEDPDGKQPYPLWEDKESSQRTFAAFLVGSKYDKDPDKVIVWIRLQLIAKYPRRLVNPYANLQYNSYDSVSKVPKGPASPPESV